MLNNKLKVKDLEEEISKLEAQFNDFGAIKKCIYEKDTCKRLSFRHTL